MKIGVDAGSLGVADERLKVGVYRMSVGLFSALADIDKVNEYALYSFLPINRQLLRRFGSRVRNEVVGPRMGWRSFGLPIRLIMDKPDVFLGLSQSLPLMTRCPSVVIVHDVAFERYPRFFPDSYEKLRALTRDSLQKATRVVSVSRTTKSDLIHFYRTPDSKIKVVYEGYDDVLFRPRMTKKENYFLYVGSLKRSKNIKGLLRAFKTFLDKYDNSFKLKISGSSYWFDPEIKKTIDSLGLSSKIEMLGFVKDSDLVSLYQNASAFVSPAFWEGFGITYLEAAACGCPVIASSSGAVKEILGRAAIYVDPNDTNGISLAMKKVLNKNKTDKMLELGLREAKKYRWNKFAKGVLETIYESCDHSR